jgi:CRP-like cAMP-binding protein
MLWSVIRGTLVYLLAEIGSGPLWGQILLGTYLLILIAPVIALFFSTLLIIAFNFRTTVQAPLRTMHKFAHRIARRSVTDSTQVVSFLQNIPLYAILDTKDLHQLCRHLTLMKTGRNSTILTLGEKGDAFYTIVSGCVEVIKEDASGAENIVETLTTGDSFGEIALLEAVPRTATIRTREPTVLFKLEKKHFNTFIAESVERRDKITDLIRMSRRIMNCPVFSQCTPKQVHAIVMHTERKIIEEGTTIFSQDEEGDRFYLIESGCIHLKRTEEGKTVWEKKVSDGDFFGEIALAKKIPRTASAIACSSASLLTLSGKDFYTIISSNLLSGIEIDTAAKRRLAQLGKEAACASS